MSRSLFGLLDGMRQRRKASDSGQLPWSPHKKLRLDPNVSSQIIQRLDEGQITEDTIHASLVESIDTEIPNTLDMADLNDNDTTDAGKKAKIAATLVPAVPLYIIPLFNLDDATHDVIHPLFTFRPIVPLTSTTIGS